MLTANESILRAARKSDEMLEPYEWKRSCTVLRRERAGNRPDLADWFRKGEHKHVFAYGIETACDKHGWILGYSIHPGNEHDSRTFKTLYDKRLSYHPEMMVLDAGYKTPAIAHLLMEDQIEPLFPYKCPQTKKGFFRKYEYVYDEY